MLPTATIKHPYPSQRLRVTYPKQEPYEVILRSDEFLTEVERLAGRELIPQKSGSKEEDKEIGIVSPGFQYLTPLPDFADRPPVPGHPGETALIPDIQPYIPQLSKRSFPYYFCVDSEKIK
jgi:hypothetical protein